MKKLLVTLAFGLLGTSAFASGFFCDGGDGYRVKLFNHTNIDTRIPSVMVVSHLDADPSTLLVARNSQIRKTNRKNTVRYTVDGYKMDADQVILQINFKEGRDTLNEGDTVSGQLIIVETNGSREVTELTCQRYLKSK